ncbi:MAG: 16S rRNA (cytidine(1402)-2'-O)-methyltransferase [Chloroflexota bacterium]|nr:16S rRNA (cytidine(1402)-2'-O)-methyltransferase [Chloroflexota bacterium]
MPTLYIVATPIGNLEDISLRALRTLGAVELIAAEDTRKTRQLLAAYGLKRPITSYHEHNKMGKLPAILSRLASGDVALVSEAGTPGISDPGYELVTAAIERGIPVVAIPGPSALVSALAVSGLPTDQFLYLGFLPRRKGPRRRLLERVAAEERTLVAFEAPHRLTAALTDILECLGDRRLAVCRELSKLHEEVFRGAVSAARDHFQEPIGEFTLVIAGQPREAAALTAPVMAELRRMHDQGLTVKEAVSHLARETGLPRRELYRAWHEL